MLRSMNFISLNLPFKQEYGILFTPLSPQDGLRLKWVINGTTREPSRSNTGTSSVSKAKPRLQTAPDLSRAKESPGIHCGTTCNPTYLTSDPITLLYVLSGGHGHLIKWASYPSGLLMFSITQRGSLVFSCPAPGKSPTDLDSSEWHRKLTDPNLQSSGAFFLKL